MVRIPRAEPSLQPQIAMQPQASGSGWGAPGRAMQQLGKSIASLGDVFDGLGQEQIAEQDFQDKMLMLKTDNELGLNQVETHASYQGNGDDYLPQRTEYYATTTNDAVSRMQPRNQQKAALFFEQRRGPYLERDATFGGKRRQETLIGTINDTVSTEYGKLATAPPEEFEQRFQETVEGVNAIIGASPLPDKLKEEVAKDAAEQAYGVLNGLAEDPETAPEIVPKILKMIEEQPEEIDGGALESEPVPEQVVPENGAEGVQGLPGSPSGPALPKPQKLGATGLEPPQSPQQASFRILDTEAPTHAERNRIFRQGGVVVNLDTNSGTAGKPTTPMVVIPDNATQAQRKAAEAYAGQMAQLYRDKFGVDLTPKVVKRSVNGRGRPSTIHTEPYAVTDPRAVAYFQTPEGVSAHAQILRDTLGKIPGVVFSIPHDPTRKGDHGAEANGVNEVALAKLVLADLKGGGSAPSPQRFAEANRLGGPDEESGSIRGPNKIPGEPKLISGPTPVRVADASGRFVPQEKQNWRSVNSHLRDLLIKNSAHLKRQMLEAETKQDQKTKATLRAYRDKLTTEGFDLMYSGKLTREWVEESKDFLTPEKYGQFLKHISGTGTARTDPETYLDLMDRIEDEPEAVIAEAREHYLDKTLTKGDFDSLTRKANRQLNPDTSLPTWAKDLKGMLKEQTAPHGFASLDRISRAIDARRAWDGYVEEKLKSGKLDPNDLKKYTLDAITAFRQRRAVETKQTLPVPQAWTQSTGDSMTLEEVDAATQKLLQALNLELATAGDDPVARKAITDKYASDAALLQKWKRTLQDEAIAKGEKLPPPKPPMKLGGPKPEQGTVNKDTPQSQGVPGQPGSQSGPAQAKQQPQQGESRPVGGALGVVPLAENPDGSVSLSVPGMILEPWRAFQRGWARMGQVGNVDESGRMYTASDAAKDSTEDATIAGGVPLAATSFGSAVGAVPKGALGSGMARAGEQAAAKEISPQGFYSGLDEALKGFNGTDVVTAGTLAKRGVKKSEIEARGLSDLLLEGKSAKVSDLQKVAGENRVEVRETKYGDNNPEFTDLQKRGAELRGRIDALKATGRKRDGLLGRGKSVDELEAEWSAMNARWREMDASSPKTKWSTYSLDPDNPTYRETVLHLPEKDSSAEWKALRAKIEEMHSKTPPTGDPRRATHMAEIDRMRDQADAIGGTTVEAGNFRSGHFPEPNVIAHARTSIQKDAQGKDVFVVNELQSDWGQKLRDGGVRDEAKIAELRKRFDEADLKYRRESGRHPSDPIRIDAEREHGLLQAELRTAEASTPGHPLVNTTDQWVNTGLRRMIAQAVESGADQIAIPSGETIKAFKMGGKEDGIKYAYDQMYPKNLRNILKKIDPSIEPQVVDHLFGQKGQKLERSKGFITFKITPKLREAVKKDGMPLFSGGAPFDMDDDEDKVDEGHQRQAYEDASYDARTYVERATRPKRIGPDNPNIKYDDIQSQYDLDYPRDAETPPEARRWLRKNRRVLD